LKGPHSEAEQWVQGLVGDELFQPEEEKTKCDYGIPLSLLLLSMAKSLHLDAQKVAPLGKG
ncbi:MAG TPA: hypothetical protein VE176_09710, partial [Candidatus Limnocylindrales bacterium]|nr:hypothetical protein [Candidatus Limnocylindrales bacterium]